MKRFHVKHGMKKALALSLAMAMVVPGAIAVGSIHASAEELPTPARSFDLEKGFKGDTDDAKDNLKQAKFGSLIGMIEDKYSSGQYQGLSYFDPLTGRLTGKYQEVDKVLVQLADPKSYDSAKGDHKGYTWANIPTGEKKQYLPDIKTSNGEWLQVNCAWNQPTTAYDEEKGMVFWMDNTLINESYPTYATEVDWENGTWETKDNLIVKDAIGQYQEFEIINSAAEFDNPFSENKDSVTGITFSAWIKNTTPYRSSVVYGTLGDVDGVKGISVDDALAILRHAAGAKLLSATAQKYANVNGDVDGNGTPIIDVDDALWVLKVAAGVESDFPVTLPEPEEGDDEVVEDPEPLEDAEFFHVEVRELGKTYNEMTKKEETDERNITKRQYLYFSGNGVVYVGDFEKMESTCTWTLDEESKSSEALNILDGRNGSKWNYVSYTFDGTNFHMYVNGVEATLERTAGEDFNASDILDFVKNSKAVTYLGGRGGGMKDNFNTFRIGTSDAYYMDDIDVYTCALSSDQVAQAYSEAVESKEAAEQKEYSLLRTYSFEGGTSMARNNLSAVDSTSAFLPDINVDGKEGKAIKLKISESTKTGGVQLTANPFRGLDLTGATISYWLKSERGGVNHNRAVEDGLVISFLDDPHECTTEKLASDGWTGAKATARTQLCINKAFNGYFCEGATGEVNSRLKNTFNYAPYPFGDPDDIEWWRVQYETKNHSDGGSYYQDALDLKNSLAEDWHFITVTFNNLGFTMYDNGEEVKNLWTDFKGDRFCDAYWTRSVENEIGATRKGTNNGGARSLMDFLTASDTKVYIGYGFVTGGETTFLTSSECWLDELSFYDKDLSAAEVKALYEAAIQ